MTVAVLVMLSAIAERQGACDEPQSVDAPLNVDAGQATLETASARL